MSGTEKGEFYDVTFLFFILLNSIQVHTKTMKDTSCYNKSISRLELGTGQVTQLRYLNRPERQGPRSPRRELGNVSTTCI